MEGTDSRMKNNYIDIKDLSDSRELLEAKYPKAITVFIVTLLSILCAGFIWCYFGKIDTFAVASGEIRTEDPSSSLSSLSGGKISSINKTDGESVKKDDIILTIDSEYYEEQKEVINKQISERKIKIDDYNLLSRSIKNDKNYFNKSNSLYFEYENYALDLKESLNNIDNSNEQIENSIKEYELAISQNNTSKSSISSQINDFNILIDCINGDTAYTGTVQTVLNAYNSYNSLYLSLDPLEPDYPSKLSSLKSSTINDINKVISELEAELININSTIESYELKKSALSYTDNKEDIKQKLKNSYYITIDNNIETLNNEIVNLEGELSKLDETLDSLSIKATSDGTLIYLKDYTLGDTINPSEQVASIIPNSSIYKVVLYLPENKISEVSIGQDIEYIINSISLTDYGKIKGKIESISPDSFSEQTSGQKFYKVISTLDKTFLTNKKDGQIRNLKVGMLVEGHIITGSQTILTYLLDKLNFN